MEKENFYTPDGQIKNKDTAHDIAKIEDKGHQPVPRTAIEKVSRYMPWNMVKEKMDVNKAQNEAEEYEKMRREQFEIGEEIFAELEKAARENKEFNVLDGQPVEGVGPMRVWKMENNGVQYSIVVQVESSKAMGGNYPLYQVDVNLAKPGNEIHVFSAPYGPENNYSKDQKSVVINSLRNQVSRYRLYTSNHPSAERAS